jgi:K+-sensing histidine kinase KdpD
MHDISDKSISSINHTIKNVLATQIAYAQLAKRAQENGEHEKALETLKKLENQTRLLTTMIIDVGEWIKLSRNSQVMSMQEINFAEVIQTIVTQLQKHFPENIYSLDVKPVMGYLGDHEKIAIAIQRILTTLSILMTNSLTMKIRLRQNKNVVQIEVVCLGLVIPRERLRVFFEPFQLIECIKGNNHTGLELAVAHAFISLHSGTLAIKDSKLGCEILCVLPYPTEKRT